MTGLPVRSAQDNPLLVTRQALEVLITFYIKEIKTEFYIPDQDDQRLN